MHEDVDTHDTERNISSDVDAFGLSTTDHELPFHNSTNVSVAVSVPVEPTATHHEVDTHDTDDKVLPVSALGLGTTVIVSIAASAGVDITTDPNKSAETATAPDSHLRTIRNSQRNVRSDSTKRCTDAAATRVLFRVLHEIAVGATYFEPPVTRFRST
jgi:hypothetical protein